MKSLLVISRHEDEVRMQFMNQDEAEDWATEHGQQLRFIHDLDQENIPHPYFYKKLTQKLDLEYWPENTALILRVRKTHVIPITRKTEFQIR